MYLFQFLCSLPLLVPALLCSDLVALTTALFPREGFLGLLQATTQVAQVSQQPLQSPLDRTLDGHGFGQEHNLKQNWVCEKGNRAKFCQLRTSVHLEG